MKKDRSFIEELRCSVMRPSTLLKNRVSLDKVVLTSRQKKPISSCCMPQLGIVGASTYPFCLCGREVSSSLAKQGENCIIDEHIEMDSHDGHYRSSYGMSSPTLFSAIEQLISSRCSR